MKKRMIFIATMLLVLCACAVQQSASPTNPDSSTVESSSQPALDNKLELLDYGGVRLNFVRPEEAYDILGITTFGEGYAVIYQQAMPDSFNKIFSPSDVFYNISTQLFTAEGAYLKTVDSQWHNAIKITEPLLRLTPHTDTITFEIWRENETGHTEANCFTLAITEEGLQTLGENPNHYYYSYHLFNELIADGEAQLQYAVDYNSLQGKDVLRFRLAAPEGEVAERIVPVTDASFSNALYNTVHGIDQDDWLNDQQNPLYMLDVSLNTQAKTASLSNGKITCGLNFSNGTPGYSVTRRYTEAMLGEMIATSPDGTRQIYSADFRNYFESPGGCDYVVREAEGFKFLFAGSELDQLYFLDNDRIWVNTFGALRFYDATSGVPLLSDSKFDFGTQQNPYNKSMSGIARIVVGTAVDMENHVLLVAHRPYTFGSGVLWQGTAQQTQALPVTLTVLDWDGRPLREYNTGKTMRAFAKFSINVLSVNVNGDGTADLLWSEEQPVQVRYLT
ncbi:hypothetical protein ACS3UN_09345 [Oscillospiraceae bacterium LTW-04]|nr:hypothetical protein RBH76_11105 [Oscillospiraceae bacterium MB24-C1]